MTQRINGSVGSWRKKALNRPDEVTVIQKRLAAAATTTRNKAFDPRGVDGDIRRSPRSSATVDAKRIPGVRKHAGCDLIAPVGTKVYAVADGKITKNGQMLHFEMYQGTSSGSYTKRSSRPYQRRDDLMNPTTYLDKWKTNLPST